MFNRFKKTPSMALQNEEYLAANRSKEGVTETASGLQYRVIKEGTGNKPAARDTVLCHYEGSLVDGKMFDSSRQRGAPASFPVSALIPGFTEGLLLMQEGAVYEFVIPSEIGYGAAGAGGMIPGGATLVFEVELIEIQ